MQTANETNKGLVLAPPHMTTDDYEEYTQLKNGQLLIVVPEGGAQHRMSKKVFKNVVIFGYEMTGDGAETGLTIDHVYLTLNRDSAAFEDELVSRSYKEVSRKETIGAWITPNGERVTENGLMLSFPTQTPPGVLFVEAERLRALFRQHSVLVADNKGVVHFVTNEGA